MGMLLTCSLETPPTMCSSAGVFTHRRSQRKPLSLLFPIAAQDGRENVLSPAVYP